MPNPPCDDEPAAWQPRDDPPCVRRRRPHVGVPGEHERGDVGQRGRRGPAARLRPGRSTGRFRVRRPRPEAAERAGRQRRDRCVQSRLPIRGDAPCAQGTSRPRRGGGEHGRAEHVQLGRRLRALEDTPEAKERAWPAGHCVADGGREGGSAHRPPRRPDRSETNAAPRAPHGALPPSPHGPVEVASADAVCERDDVGAEVAVTPRQAPPTQIDACGRRDGAQRRHAEGVGASRGAPSRARAARCDRGRRPRRRERHASRRRRPPGATDDAPSAARTASTSWAVASVEYRPRAPKPARAERDRRLGLWRQPGIELRAVERARCCRCRAGRRPPACSRGKCHASGRRSARTRASRPVRARRRAGAGRPARAARSGARRGGRASPRTLRAVERNVSRERTRRRAGRATA